MESLEKLAGIEVLGLDGAGFRVGGAWKDKTAVVVFIRHFG